MIIGISGKIGSGKDTVGEIIQYLVWANKYESKDYNLTSFSDLKSKYKSTFEENKTLSKFIIMKFANDLKDIICLLTSCTRDQLEDHAFKDLELGEEWNCIKVSIWTTDGYGKPYFYDRLFTSDEEKDEWYHNKSEKELYINEEKVIMTRRKLLQLVGTNCGRNIIHPNIWVNSLFSNYVPTLTCRMDFIDFSGNEAKTIKGKEREVEHHLGSYPNWIITDMRFPNELKAIKSRRGITIRIDRDMEFTVAGKKMYLSSKDYHNLNNSTEHESETALDNAKFDYTINNNGTVEELVIKVKEILIKENIIKDVKGNNN